jgi:hypothetical protein
LREVSKLYDGTTTNEEIKEEDEDNLDDDTDSDEL